MTCKKVCDDSCEHFMYIGDGDAICYKGAEPKNVLIDWNPAENYLCCKGVSKDD